MSRFSELKAVGPCYAVSNSPITRGSKGHSRGRTAPTALLYGGCILEIIIIGLVAFAAYKFLRHTKPDKTEAVRAYLFLDALNKGLSVETANAIADHILVEPASERVKNAKRTALMEYKLLHGGNELPVIGHAYRHGMRSTRPDDYRKKALATQDTLAIEVSYTMKRMQITAELKEATSSADYQAFYQEFSDEVFRLSGERPDAPAFGKGWEQVTLLEHYRDGNDALYVAARFCDEHHQTKEKFDTFEEYRAAVLDELRRYVAGSALLAQWPPTLTDMNVQKAFASSMHPRRAAYGLYRSRARQQAAAVR